MRNYYFIRVCIFLFVALLGSVNNAHAEYITIDGITYNAYPSYGLAEVTQISSDIVNVVIPETVSDSKGNSYTVVQMDYGVGGSNIGATGAVTVTLPPTISYIGDFVFRNCIKLEEINLDKVTQLGKRVFEDCTSLKSVNLNSITEMASEAFAGCTSLKSVTLSNMEKIDYANFRGCTGLEEVTVGLSTIPNETFKGCTNLKKAHFTENVRVISTEAFRGCGLTEVMIPNTVTKIDKYAFQDCNEVKYMYLGEGLTSVSNLFFEDSKALETLVVRCKEVPSAFQDCTQLTAIDFGDKVETIKSSAFVRCTSLPSIVFPDNISMVNANAFDGCTNLKSVTFGKNFNTPTTYTSIFAYCPIETVIIHCTTYKTNYVGRYCTTVKEVYFNDNLKAIPEEAFYGWTSMASPHLPSSLESIGANAFSQTTFEELVIPDGVKTLGAYLCYDNQNLKTISLPVTLTSVGRNINNGYYKTVIVRGETPFAINENVFPSYNATLVVPSDAAVSRFSTTHPWSKFYSIVKDDTTTSISEISVQPGQKEMSDKLIYNLNGQRLNTPQRGINIANGRKVVIK